ncbi:alkaline phosphatase [Brevundimonas sp.]|uniref:alkaline phosphatase D family protein n=1 Tax=Brevundimonas sp. TaxID=1871086 RepID=UPI00351862CC
MKIDRRGLLGLFGAGTASCATAPDLAPVAAVDVRFDHGVASGDPAADSVVLWTRVTPPEGFDGTLTVTLEIAGSSDLAGATAHTLTTGGGRDYTVKHVVTGLAAGRDYYFRFRVGNAVSPVGRTRTLPAGATPKVTLAVVSCQLYPGGLFNAHDAIARLERLDAVVHLGDYIYEYGADDNAYGMATGRRLNRLPDPPHEIVSLADYRRRHAQYKTDPDLQAAHARAPFICVWDDHEVTNDSWVSGAESHQPETEGDYAARKAAALKAYYEWMPIREPAPGTLSEAINRTFHFGDLASLMMVETRLTARTAPLDHGDLTMRPGPDGTPVPDVEAFMARRNDPARELLGDSQRAWLGRELAASRQAGRPWQVLGNQVVMARVQGPDVTTMLPPAQIERMLAGLTPEIRAQVEQVIGLFKLGVPFNLDAWDGFPAARERLYRTFREAGVQPLVLAGDSHAFWVNALHDYAGERRAVEFGTSAVSSPSPADALGNLPLGMALSAANEEVVFCDQASKGFVLMTLTPGRADVALMAVSTIVTKPYELRAVKRYRVDHTAAGAGALVEV